MTHEQLAKKFIRNLYLVVNVYIGPTQEKAINDFFRHLKEAIKKDIQTSTNKGNEDGR